jgi:hypothetical protein
MTSPAAGSTGCGRQRLLETGCRIFLPGHGTAIERALLERRYEERCRRVSTP